MSDTIDNAIRKALHINMGWQNGERVAIIAQLPNGSSDQQVQAGLRASFEVAQRMHDVLRSEIGSGLSFLAYSPTELRHGADAPQALYEKAADHAVIFLPTGYSLTHTDFRKHLTAQGARIASMPTFRLEMFAEDGPMNVDYANVDRATKEVAANLRASRYVRVTGKDTDITVEVDPSLVKESSGMMTKPGEYGNLPGAEAFVVPVHEGNSNGYITIPAGWGGPFPLAQQVRLSIENGRFTGIESSNEGDHAQIESILFGGENYNVLAELGIGTNPNITNEYVAKHGWSILTAEKIAGSAHFANGNSKMMGGQNDVPVHVDWFVPNVKIEYKCR